MKPKTTVSLLFLDLFLLFFTTHINKGPNGKIVESVMGIGFFQLYCMVLIGFLFISPILLISYYYNKEKQKEQKQLEIYRQTLSIQYIEALNGGDKGYALQCGRVYYQSYGIYDEQRIQNDLLCYLNNNK